MVADEVEHGQDGLVLRTPQAAAELLQEDGCALGGTEQQHGVDVGHVEALVEEVDGEQRVDASALAQVAAEPARAPLAASSPLTVPRGMPASLKAARHELRVRHADAEAERPHGARVRDLVA